MKRPLRAMINKVAPTVARHRVVLLGASNLTKSIGHVLAAAHGAWGRPLEVIAALGHGRSYGRSSRVFGRELPGILECGLWNVLGQSPEVPTAALVTDIGNDLLYEEPVERIVGWVETSLDRLAAAQARTVVTLLPLDNLEAISRFRFILMRTLLVPRSRISLEELRVRAYELNEHVRRLAAERGFDIVPQRAAWYGFDPVHIRWGKRSLAWREILSPWRESLDAVAASRTPISSTIYLRWRVPARRRILGFEQRSQQPSGRLNDGTTVALY